MAGVNQVTEHTAELLSAYLDGELTKSELREVVEVLETNQEAVALFRGLQATRRTVRTLPTLDMPIGLIPDAHLGDQLSAYLDGELITAEIPAVSEHIEHCSECRHELAELDRARIAVRALPGVEPPDFLMPRVEDRKEADDPSRVTRLRRRTAVAVAAGVAAIALLFVAMPLVDDSAEPSSVSIVDLGSRHGARVSNSNGGVVGGATGFQVDSP